MIGLAEAERRAWSEMLAYEAMGVRFLRESRPGSAGKGLDVALVDGVPTVYLGIEPRRPAAP